MTKVDDDFIEMGKISGHFGVKGWLKVYSYSEPMEQILNYKKWFLQKNKQWQVYNIEQGRRQGKTVVVKLAGFDSNEQAAVLIGQKIAIQHQQLPKKSKQDYYWVELIGLDVYNQDNIYFGQVKRLFETGSNDVMEVETAEESRLIPYIEDQVIQQIDLKKNRIEVDWDADF